MFTEDESNKGKSDPDNFVLDCLKSIPLFSYNTAFYHIYLSTVFIELSLEQMHGFHTIHSLFVFSLFTKYLLRFSCFFFSQ